MSFTSKIKVGLFGIGLNTYWKQFDGLFERLENYQKLISERISNYDVEVINVGIVDTPQKAIEKSSILKKSDVDIIFLYISTYALSSTVLPIVQRIKVPVVVLNLQPVKSIDYEKFNSIRDRETMTGEWLAHCQAVTAPEIAAVFNRAGIDYHLITGYLNDPEAWKEIEDWIDAAKTAQIMRNNRVGLLGHYYNGMLDVYSDLTKLSATFGSHFQILEMDELKMLRDQVTEDQIKEKIDEFMAVFDVSSECSNEELQRAAKTSCALDALVRKNNLNSLAYYYEGTSGNEYEDIITSVIAGNSLLTAKHVPVAGEYEVKNVLAMKILDSLNAGGSFSEFYAMDFNDDVVLLGHDGPAHFSIAEGKVGLVPLQIYHGKPGKGLSIQMEVKHGPVTLLSVVQNRNGDNSFLVAEGESVPGPTLQIGNTNSRYHFPIGIKSFINKWSEVGPSHHCAIGIGHVASKIEKLSKILRIDYKQIC
ncbi:MAG: arabinose isomerase [Athalassotoga sp.]